jgi:hypothetical protein
MTDVEITIRNLFGDKSEKWPDNAAYIVRLMLERGH